MKKRTLTKLTIFSALGVAAIVPALTLTSCAQISQYYLPILVGGSGINSPFELVDLNTKDNAREQSYDSTNKTGYNSPSISFDQYIPSSFISFNDRSSSSTSYEYASPYTQNTVDATPTRGDYAYYNTSSSSDSFPSSISDVQLTGTSDNTHNTSVTSSIQNLNMLMSPSMISIASGVDTITSTLLQFMSQTGLVNNKDENSWYNAIFNSTNFHGNKDDDTAEQNKEFFELMYDLNNLLSEGNTSVKFAESYTNFRFVSSLMGPGPYVSADNETYPATSNTHLDRTLSIPYDYNDEHGIDSKFVYDAANKKYTVLDTNGKVTSNFVFNGPSNSVYPSYLASYTTFSSSDSNFDNNTVFKPSTISASIPFIVRPDQTEYSYFNPQKNMGFNQNDYLVNDITKVQDSIKSTNSWNTFSNHVNTTGNSPYKDKSTWAQSLTFNINNNNITSTPSNGYWSNLNTTTFIAAGDDAHKDDATAQAKYLEPALSNLFDNNISLQSNDYIGFANYVMVAFPYYDEANSRVLNDYFPIYGGIQSNDDGLPAIFPISLLCKTSDDQPFGDNTASIDGDLLTAELFPEVTAIVDDTDHNGLSSDDITNIKNDADNKCYYIDIDKLFIKEINLLKEFSSNLNIPNNAKPSDDKYSDLVKQFKLIQLLYPNSSDQIFTH